MIKKVLYYLHLRKSNFIQVLVHQKKSHLIGLGEISLWAYYRLGMYGAVSKMVANESNWHDIFAKGVSYAACGMAEESKTCIEKMCSNPAHKKHLVSFADALAPYMPKEALAIVETLNAPVSLHTALLLKMGERSKAQMMLDEAIGRKEGRKKPELFLYRSNTILEADGRKKLTYMNLFLSHHAIPKIRLKEKNKPLSATNIECRDALGICDGPLISVLMTTFESQERLHSVIESILQQSYTNIELLIVNDASRDATAEIIQEWVKNDARVKYIQLNTNVGTYVAKNIALMRSCGEFVTCHDSDDWSHPLKLEMQVKPLLKNKELVATTSCWVRLDEQGFYYARLVHPLMRINPSSLLFRRELVVRYAGIWDCVRTGADSEFLARLLLVFGRKAVKKITKPLSFGSHRADSLMNASVTGYCEVGTSPQRLSYWESWNDWHIQELSSGHKPFISSDMLLKRQFEAPESIMVAQDDIRKCLE